jgi:hypothetical protein
MDVIGHENIGINLNRIKGFSHLETRQVIIIILDLGENHLTVVTPVYDMMGEIGRYGTRAAWHC